MGYEIELKAWVSDWATLEEHLRESCEFVREFQKSDRYFRSRTGNERDTSFRLRMDGDAAIVTFKEKKPRGGIEFNREREFTVDDAEAFLELIGRTDSEEYIAKVKTGLEFRSDGMTVELLRLDQVGAFLEIEIIEQRADPAVHEAAARKIKAFLATTGISEDKIEARSYVNLLRRDEVGEDGPGA
jgi:predicted adenylyl cyclase CyaB